MHSIRAAAHLVGYRGSPNHDDARNDFCMIDCPARQSCLLCGTEMRQLEPPLRRAVAQDLHPLSALWPPAQED